MDEVVEDDPYRVIMFSDIEDFLIQLPPNPKGLRRSCVDAFLLFCRLPPIATLDLEIAQKWVNDPLVRDELLECSSAWITNEYFSKSRNADSDIGPPSYLHNPFPNSVGTPELLFGKTLAGNGTCLSEKVIHNYISVLTQMQIILVARHPNNPASKLAMEETTAPYPQPGSSIHSNNSFKHTSQRI